MRWWTLLHISFLRGLNVPGRSVKMDHLRGLFTDLGFTGVRSYIQSGNIFFESDETDQQVLTRRIRTRLSERLGYDVAVCLRTVPALAAVVELDPFQAVTLADDLRFCVVFSTTPVPDDLQLPLVSPKGDMEIIGVGGHEAFVVWHLIGGRAPAAKGFQERILGRDATTRYFHTVVKILAAARGGG
jgi:uncharacterized protein (DUF1697 family)